MRLLIFAAMIVAGTVSGQTMFKCSNAGKIEYSDRSCLSGNEVKRIALDGGTNAEVRARASTSLNAERAQIGTEEQADAARSASQVDIAMGHVYSRRQAVAVVAAKQANEKVTALDRTGWPSTTRGAQVQQQTELAYAAQIAQQQTSTTPQGPRNVASCDPAGCWDTTGTRYNGGAGGVFFSSDGRTCNRAGSMLNCN